MTIAFYEQLGFTNDHVIGLGKRLRPQRPSKGSN